MTDNLSNMIANINRASSQSQLSTLLPNTGLNRSSLTVLHRLGYIRGFVVLDEKRVRAFIKFSESGPVIRSIKRVSKPGNRVYASARSWSKSFLASSGLSASSLSIFVLSTSAGILTHLEAVKRKAGGEILFVIN